MSDYASLFLNKFNPCSDRVDSIEKYLLGELDEALLPELMDHIEKCKRCRRYHGFMESVEKGFKDHEIEASEISPLGAAELPSALQTEMVEAMKRNLSKWMFEMGRSIMYRQGMVSPLFIDLSEHQPLFLSLNTSMRIAGALKKMKSPSSDDLSHISHAVYLLKNLDEINLQTDKNSILQILNLCINFNSYNILPYYLYADIYASVFDYKASIDITKAALKCYPTLLQRCTLNNDIGRFEFKSGNIDKSIEYIKNALSSLELPHFYLNLGIANLTKNNFEKAYLNFNKSLLISNTYFSIKHRSKLLRYCHAFLLRHSDYYEHIIKNNHNLNNLFKDLRKESNENL